MKYLLHVVGILILLSLSNCEKIKLVTDKTSATIQKNNNTLIFFTVMEKCNLCDDMNQAFKETFKNNKLLNMSLNFVKVDVTRNPKTVQFYQVNNIPSIKLVMGGNNVVDYGGITNSTDIINWLKKKLLSPIIEFTNLNQLTSAVQKSENCLIYFGTKEGSFYQIFVNLSEEFTQIEFLHCYSSDCKSHYRIDYPSKLILSKYYGKNILIINSAGKTQEKLKYYLSMKFHSDLLKFDQKLSIEIFSEGYPALFLYRSQKEDNDNILENIMIKLAKQLRGKIKVIISDIESDIEKNFADFLAISKDDLPTVRIFDAREILKKYKFNGTITFDNLYQFYIDWNDNKILPYLRSDKPVEYVTGQLFKLVGDNYWPTIFDKSKDVLVLYYRHSDDKIENTLKIIEEFARIVRKNKDLKICAINLNLNEIEPLDVEKTPSIRLYPSGKKEGFLEYKEAEITLSDLRIFVKKYSKYRVIYEKSDL